MGVELKRIGAAPEPLPEPLYSLALPERQLQSVVLLADGDTCVVSAENGGEVYVASLSGQRVLRRLEEHTGPVNSLALAADGQLLLTASDDETIRVWDTTSWQVTAVLYGHSGYIREVAASGMTAVSGGEDGTFRVWDLESAVCRGVFDDHGMSVDHVTVSPDGRRAASSSRANKVLLWDLSGPKLERELYDTGQTVLDVPGMQLYLLAGQNRTGIGHNSAPKGLLFDATHNWLYTAADEVICWDLADGSERSRLPRRRYINAMAAHPELPFMATVSMDGIHYAGLDGEFAYFHPGPGSSSATTVAFLPDGRTVSGHDADYESEHCTIHVWRALTGRERRGDHHSTRVDEVAVDAAGRWAATTDNNGVAFLWDLSDGNHVATLATGEDIECAPFFTPDASRLVVPVREHLNLVPTAGGETVRIPAPDPEPEPGLAPDPKSDTDTDTGTGTDTDTDTDTDETPDRDAWLRIYAAGPIDDDTALVVPSSSPPEVWTLSDGTRRPLHGAAGRPSKSAPLISGQYALITATLDKDHPLLPPKSEGGPGLFGTPALQCWDLVGGELAWTRQGPPTDEHGWPCYAWAVLLRDGTAATITGYGKDSSLLILDVPTGAPRREVPMPDGYCEPPTELPDGTLALVYRKEDAVHIHEVPPNADHIEPRLTLPSSRSVRLAPARDLLFRLDDTGLHLHRLSTGDLLNTTAIPRSRGELQISPDGRSAAVGDRGGDVHIFHIP